MAVDKMELITYNMEYASHIIEGCNINCVKFEEKYFVEYIRIYNEVFNEIFGGNIDE